MTNKILYIFIILFLFVPPIYADDIECDDFESEVDTSCIEELLEENYTNSTNEESFSKNLASGFLDSNPRIKEEEQDKYYYKYYLESHMVPFAGSVDDSALSVDTFENIFVALITFLSILIGLVNFLITTIIMFLISIYQNGSLTSLIDQLLNVINQNIFQIENLTGSGIVLFGSFALVILLRNIFLYIKQSRAPLDFLKLFLSTLFLIALIPISYTEVRPIFVTFSESINEQISDGIFSTEGNSKVALKEEVFDAIAFNGFMLKNFGTINIEELSKRDNIDYDVAQERVEGVLGSNDSAIQNEYANYNNNYLSINIESSISQFIVTFLWTIHAILAGLLLSIPLILLVLLSIIETIVWNLIWIPIILLVFKIEEGFLAQFFFNRMQFLVSFTIIGFMLQFILKVILMTIELLSGMNLGFLIIADLVILLMFFLVWSVKDHIFTIFKTIMHNVPAVTMAHKTTADVAKEISPELAKIKEVVSDKLTVANLHSDKSASDETVGENTNENTYDDDVENDHDTNEIIEDNDISVDNSDFDTNESIEDNEIAVGNFEDNDLSETGNEFDIVDYNNVDHLSDLDYNEISNLESIEEEYFSRETSSNDFSETYFDTEEITNEDIDEQDNNEIYN